jgi:Homeodomain-like domain
VVGHPERGVRGAATVGGREWLWFVLSKVEQRLDAVRAVLAGASVVEVAAALGVSRISVHAWLRRYPTGGQTALPFQDLPEQGAG